MRAFALAIAIAALALSACSSKPRVFAPEQAVMAARYAAPPPAAITLYTSITKKTGEGAHSGLLITGSQRVLFDPAGNWEHAAVPERHDVKYGMNDLALKRYTVFQSGSTHDVIVQTVYVPQSVADDLIARAELTGAVPDAFCASAITSLLQDTPGFDGFRGSLFPVALSRGFRNVPGVTETKIIGVPGGAKKPTPEAAPAELTN